LAISNGLGDPVKACFDVLMEQRGASVAIPTF
jgi:hypothetical protein